jgi:glycosyltransferase involved in cell wall biosynthesis
VPMQRRIVLFDWVAGGHHPLYLRRFAEALEPFFHVVVAAPQESIRELADLRAELVSLGDARPTPPPGRSASWALRGVATTEVARLASISADVRADHIVHVYADAILPRLVTSPGFPAPLTVVLFYPRAHYPALYRTKLSGRDRVLAGAKERMVDLWRRRSDSNAVLSLDEEAVNRWARRRGVPAHWLPEPPVATLSNDELPEWKSRSGCVVYGALAERKGIDLLSRAVTSASAQLHVTLAGWTSPDFRSRLEQYAADMRASGATVDLRARSHSELEGLGVLAASKCVVLPYPRHDGMSRVLVEAAAVGTPVIVHDRGLLGHLVRRHRLGVAVDCTDPGALGAAIVELTTNRSTTNGYGDALTRFAARFSKRRFERALLDTFARAPTGVSGPGLWQSRRRLLLSRSTFSGAWLR